MILQDAVSSVALVGIGLVAVGFVHVIRQAGKPADETATRQSANTARVLQMRLFWVLLIGFVLGSWGTLHGFPIPLQHAPLDAQQVVQVVGRQWSWQITPATVQAGSLVEFRVTSDDVNHGFAIYSPEDHIVTQTQAMPGFVNKLLYTFNEPGTYTVRCLEYCGLGHVPMLARLNVIAARTAPASVPVVATQAIQTVVAAPVASSQAVQAAAAASTAAAPALAATSANAPLAAADAVALGARVFSEKCAACHQANGQGLPNAFPPLVGDPVVTARNPTEHIQTVLDGASNRTIHGVTYPAPMPGWASQLSDQEIAAVINHERTNWGNHAPTITAKDVAALRKH